MATETKRICTLVPINQGLAGFAVEISCMRPCYATLSKLSISAYRVKYVRGQRASRPATVQLFHTRVTAVYVRGGETISSHFQRKQLLCDSHVHRSCLLRVQPGMLFWTAPSMNTLHGHLGNYEASTASPALESVRKPRSSKAPGSLPTHETKDTLSLYTSHSPSSSRRTQCGGKFAIRTDCGIGALSGCTWFATRASRLLSQALLDAVARLAGGVVARAAPSPLVPHPSSSSLAGALLGGGVCNMYGRGG